MKSLTVVPVTAILIALISLNCNAANWYQVDMIVFEHLYTDGLDESWDVDPGVPDIDNSEQLVSNTSNSDFLVPFKMLPASSRKIPGVYASLKNSRQYRPFAYLVWQQPELKYKRAKDVRILLNSQSAAINHYNLVGNLKVRSGQLLHIELDLAYFFQPVDYNYLFVEFNDAVLDEEPLILPEGMEIEKSEQDERYTRLTETRRVKINEMHYFDHPLFGAIVRVSRLAPKQN